MKIFRKEILVFVIALFLSANVTSQSKSSVAESDVKIEKQEKRKKKKKRNKKVKLPKIDLSHWKVTLPVTKENGKPFEISPPEILDFAKNEKARPYMYIDSTKGAIVFHAMPTASKTSNTKYTRSELREQMVAGDNNTNWTFKQGGKLSAKIAMDEVTRDKNGKYHKVIILQIHGRLTNEQRDLIGQKDNNAPPILKVYWQNGKIRVKTKVLKYKGVSDEAILHKEAWGDDKGRTFEQEVGFRKFNIEVDVSDGKMVVSLNKNEFFVYDSFSIKKWGVFENYFKAGNYFQTRDEGAYAKVKFYDLEVTH
ncbi:polysaccharide lyase family 7 protein [Spongiivirga citrea]|uniref:Polysaccharide lyase family 7 protein n=1 Tax=Spongiivirga citrea TaxID=1481457 RepID=A0A6M0CDC2_9FLAO|nr:polysaccharide lyase family 7 protein [Spongiivirga citrea]NER15828.1 polysaccharide lyase family 7 protein [Spongiivirga citrea]